jgi:hypothetical protein
MHRDYTYRAKRNVNIKYLAGYTYRRVPEAAVRAILAAEAGSIVSSYETDDRA